MAGKSEEEPNAEGRALRESKKDEAIAFSGSESLAFQKDLLAKTASALCGLGELDEEKSLDIIKTAAAALKGIGPRDEVEGMLAAQMVATHNAAMDCLRRAMVPGQSYDGRDQNLKHAVKLLGIYERQVAALDKHRGKGRQKITVEHVTVEAGGQAIVGDVHAEGAAKPPSAKAPAALEDGSAAGQLSREAQSKEKPAKVRQSKKRK